MDYYDKTALMNLNRIDAIKHHHIYEFNHGHSSLKDEFRDCPPKTALVPENIDAVRELIMQDRPVTYREI